MVYPMSTTIFKCYFLKDHLELFNIYITKCPIPVIRAQLVYKVIIDFDNQVFSRQFHLFCIYFLDSDEGPSMQYSYDEIDSVTQNMTLTFNTKLGTFTKGTIG